VKSLTITALLISIGALSAQPSAADESRNYISIVGSTTLQPFAKAVAEQIGKKHKIKPPMIESTGTAGGFTLFCEGVGMAYPDIVNASRPMKQKELDACRSHGVDDVVEIKIGSGAAVLVQPTSAQVLDVSRKDLFLALAKNVPDPNCKTACDRLTPNPYQTWKQVNPSLPDLSIEIMGPPAGSGTREIINGTVMEASCDSYPWIAEKKTRSEAEYKRICHAIREDGAYAEETSDTILTRISGRSNAVGIVTYAAYQSAGKGLKVISVEGVQPLAARLASQSYPLTKPLLVYVKKAHVHRVPGLDRYLAELTNDQAWGNKGYLLKKGLAPMSADERKGYGEIVKSLRPMVDAGLLLPIGTVFETEPNFVSSPARKKKSQK